MTDTVDRDNYNEHNPLGDIGVNSSEFQNAFCISFFSACCGAMLGSALAKENDSKYAKGALITVNPHTPVAQKIADEMVFDVSKVKESSFFLIRTSLTPPPSDF